VFPLIRRRHPLHRTRYSRCHAAATGRLPSGQAGGHVGGRWAAAIFISSVNSYQETCRRSKIVYCSIYKKKRKGTLLFHESYKSAGFAHKKKAFKAFKKRFTSCKIWCTLQCSQSCFHCRGSRRRGIGGIGLLQPRTSIWQWPLCKVR